MYPLYEGTRLIRGLGGMLLISERGLGYRYLILDVLIPLQLTQLNWDIVVQKWRRLPVGGEKLRKKCSKNINKIVAKSGCTIKTVYQSTEQGCHAVVPYSWWQVLQSLERISLMELCEEQLHVAADSIWQQFLDKMRTCTHLQLVHLYRHISMGGSVLQRYVELFGSMVECEIFTRL